MKSIDWEFGVVKTSNIVGEHYKGYIISAGEFEGLGYIGFATHIKFNKGVFSTPFVKTKEEAIAKVKEWLNGKIVQLFKYN